MSTIADRIKEGLSLRNMKQVDLVESTGINKGALSSYLSGKYEPKQKNIYLIAKALDVNEAWLMGCDVSPERNLQVSNSNLNDIQQLLINNYNKLNDLGKKKLLDYSEDLTYNCKYTQDIFDYVPDTLAAHDDDIPEKDKKVLNNIVMEYMRNKNKDKK